MADIFALLAFFLLVVVVVKGAQVAAQPARDGAVISFTTPADTSERSASRAVVTVATFATGQASINFRLGDYTSTVVEQTHASIQNWLDEHRDRFETASSRHLVVDLRQAEGQSVVAVSLLVLHWLASNDLEAHFYLHESNDDSPR